MALFFVLQLEAITVSLLRLPFLLLLLLLVVVVVVIIVVFYCWRPISHKF